MLDVYKIVQIANNTLLMETVVYQSVLITTNQVLIIQEIIFVILTTMMAVALLRHRISSKEVALILESAKTIFFKFPINLSVYLNAQWNSLKDTIMS